MINVSGATSIRSGNNLFLFAFPDESTIVFMKIKETDEYLEMFLKNVKPENRSAANYQKIDAICTFAMHFSDYSEDQINYCLTNGGLINIGIDKLSNYYISKDVSWDVLCYTISIAPITSKEQVRKCPLCNSKLVILLDELIFFSALGVSKMMGNEDTLFKHNDGKYMFATCHCGRTQYFEKNDGGQVEYTKGKVYFLGKDMERETTFAESIDTLKKGITAQLRESGKTEDEIESFFKM